MTTTITNAKLAASALIPIVILAGMIAFLLWPGNTVLNFGAPLPDVTVERIEFASKLIIAHVRNTGPQAAEIAQVDVNDRIVPAAVEPSKDLARFGEARVVIPFEWVEGKPYEVGVTTSDGVRFAKAVPAAILTPAPDAGQASLLALLGTYVGIIPVMIGLLWLPFLKRLSAGKYLFFLSFTAGLLLFLGIDALVEANELATKSVAGAFHGQALIATVTVVSFVALLYASEKLVERGKTTTTTTTTTTKARTITGSIAVALMISVGIGLHNMGEGLAIGGSMVAGEVALGAFLIVGFTIHNTTEGLAIVAPLARERPKVAQLAALGFIAGAPAILGAWVGGFVSSPVASVVFLAVGAGAVFQVVYAIFKYTGRQESAGGSKFLSGPVAAGIAIGMLVMYLTSLLV
ncbi:putative divalent heavy-metal cations transporter [Candidatus Nitrososphaera evergladensis SR1]|uniref:Putative divalent heavy-metal cations transporter n=1 Tax=Candidatus Nitrososphaera evergladensis SR1 TaxID=1459636 RepID=A0A075MQG9_9ARCH|nr:divalent cation transporter [Candidatus Nitrososphaera evergladensis]AIF83463.1 putative divalent heavy-metal cations transporter [Candidatus Nitrososphaera evergladensis SR1]